MVFNRYEFERELQLNRVRISAAFITGEPTGVPSHDTILHNNKGSGFR